MVTIRSSMMTQENFENTKVVIRIRKSKDRQYNGLKEKGQAMIYKTLYRKITIDNKNP